ncbi:MAG: right-handed parallel beta-helix repeat-containing protein [Myxococcota bacterium]
MARSILLPTILFTSACVPGSGADEASDTALGPTSTAASGDEVTEGVASSGQADGADGADGADDADGTGGASPSTSMGSAGSTDDGSEDTDATSGGGGMSGTIMVRDVAGLRAALLGATAGDRIVVAPGVYAPEDVLEEDYAGAPRAAYFLANASGSEQDPIRLEAEDPANPPTLRGLTYSDSAYVLWIRGEYWQIQDLVLERGGKGLMLDESSHTVASRVEVYDMGDEGIHLRSGTSNALVEDCVVESVGLNQPGFGEGLYIGSDGSQWGLYEPACHNNVIRGCTVRGTRAEGVDIKEGTEGNVVEDSDFYGGEISGENFADSFIDLKGVDARVRNNRFYKEDNGTVTRGVAIVERPMGPTAQGNWIFDNEFFLDDANGVMVHAYAGSGNCAWDNMRTPAGDDYQGNAPELCFEPQR